MPVSIWCSAIGVFPISFGENAKAFLYLERRRKRSRFWELVKWGCNSILAISGSMGSLLSSVVDMLLILQGGDGSGWGSKGTRISESTGTA